MGQGPAQIFWILGEFVSKIFFKVVLGQSSLPIWVLGTIEFISARWIPLIPHHKIIPPQNNFFRDHFSSQKIPEPKCHPKISPEADFGNFSRSLQKMRTANPSEMLSRIPPSELKMEQRGKKHIFHVSNEQPWGPAIWDICFGFVNIFSSLIPYTLTMPGARYCHWERLVFREP